MMSDRIPAIQVRSLTHTIQGHQVLDDLSFTIEEGDYVGILGPNGSGKTTLLRIILGILEAQEGTAEVFGQNINTLKERALIGYVPQRASKTEWDFPATVEEVIESGRTPLLRFWQFGSRGERAWLEEAMEAVNVSHLRKRSISKLSGGERQRVFIARALAAQPKMLILDEPTTGVDVSVQHEFYAFLKRLNTERKMTIVLVSHDVDAITHETKNVLCMNKRLVCHLPTEEFLQSSHLDELFGHNAVHIMHEHPEDNPGADVHEHEASK